MGHGADWIKQGYKVEMSAFGEKVADLLDDIYGGIYHIDGSGLGKVRWDNDHYIELMLVDHRCHALSTFDFDDLTALVLLSHDRCIRIAITPGTFRNVRLIFHPREREQEGMSFGKKMPTIEDHIAAIRKRYDKSAVAAA